MNNTNNEVVPKIDRNLSRIRPIDRELMMEWFHCDAEKGILTWKKNSKKIRAGAIAGVLIKGYIKLSLQNKVYLAHRVIWAIVHGDFNNKYIDHINGIKTDNRISNLRLATAQENTRNNTPREETVSGIKGVRFISKDRKFYAYIGVNYRTVYLGASETLEGAAELRRLAEIKYFGDFSHNTTIHP